MPLSTLTRALLTTAFVALVAHSAASVATASVDADAEYHRYLILGAGPGGLQLAHFLHSARRDYLVLDKAHEAGSFFRRFPRWRQLISINKWATGRPELEFTQRHDWNSLLNEPSPSCATPACRATFNASGSPCLEYDAKLKRVTVARNRTCPSADFSGTDSNYAAAAMPRGMRMRDYSKKYYPDADDMVTYLNHFGGGNASRGLLNASLAHLLDAHERAPLHVAYGVNVVRISRAPGANTGFGLEALATGAPRFRVTTATGQLYECTVLILAAGFQKLNRAEGKNVAEVADNYWTASTNLEDYEDKHVLILGRGNGAFEFANNVMEVAASVHLLGRMDKRVSPSWETHYPGDVRMVHAKLLEAYLLKSMDAMAEAPQKGLEIHFNNASGRYYVDEESQVCTHDHYGRTMSRCFFRKEYDKIISVPGWKFDNSMFDPEVKPAVHANRKHANINARYEVVNVPGMFVAGALMHAHDFKKSSGGFVHGFRYLIRALHRILEEDEQAASESMLGRAAARVAAAAVSLDASGGAASRVTPHPPASWPRRPINSLRAGLCTIMRRINNAAAPYQMFGGVGDVYVLPPLTPKEASGFVQVGVGTATVDPGTFYDEDVYDEGVFQVKPNLPPIEELDADLVRSDEVINAALRGAYFEDVPVKLVAEKVPLWSAQTAYALQASGFDAGDISTHGALTSSGGGLEYLLLTLEFGRGSSSAPREKAANSPFTPGIQEWARDPFSLARANVSLYNPEDSHFLHPVLRYYNTRMDADKPVVECHVIEDFSTNWTHYVAHILPVARCLQDIGGRRARAALDIAEELGSSASAALKPASVDMRAAQLVLEDLWHVKRESNSHYDVLRHHMQVQSADLWYGGMLFPAGEGWHFFLSTNATDELFYRGPRMMLVHFVDVIPIEPTPAEMAEVDALRRKMQTGEPFNTYAPRVPVALNKEQRAAKVRNQRFLRQFYSHVTASLPGLALISIDVRSPIGRIHSESLGVTNVPLFRVYDQWRGTMDLTAKEYPTIYEDTSYLLQTHYDAFVALQDDDDSFLFPGFTLEMMRGGGGGAMMLNTAPQQRVGMGPGAPPSSESGMYGSPGGPPDLGGDGRGGPPRRLQGDPGSGRPQQPSDGFTPIDTRPPQRRDFDARDPYGGVYEQQPGAPKQELNGARQDHMLHPQQATVAAAARSAAMKSKNSVL